MCTRANIAIDNSTMTLATNALLRKYLAWTACVLLGLGLLTNEVTTARRESPWPMQSSVVQPPPARSLTGPYDVTLGTSDNSDDALDTGPKLPADLASEAGVTAAFAMSCGDDPAPIRLALESMLKSLKLDSNAEAYLLQRYHSTILSTVATLEKESLGYCRNLGSTLRSTIRDLSSPAS